MLEKDFTGVLFNQLQKICGERQELLRAQESLTREEKILQRRLGLLRELLILEGVPVDMQDLGMKSE